MFSKKMKRVALWMALILGIEMIAMTTQNSYATAVENTIALRNPRVKKVAVPVNEYVYYMTIHSKWDLITFGEYWQTDTNQDGVADQNDEKTPIKWRVLDVNQNEALLLSDVVLDYRGIRTTYAPPRIWNWKSSTIRSWLNGYSAEQNAENGDFTGEKNNFINEAFNSSEKAVIKKADVIADDASYGGEDTKDKVFLMAGSDFDDDRYGFSLDGTVVEKSKVARTTQYAIGLGMETCPYGGVMPGEEYDKKNLLNGVLTWWTRSMASDEAKNFYFNHNGGGGYAGSICIKEGIRPAIRVDLSDTSLWEYAGTVDENYVYSDGSDEEEESTATPTATPTVSPTATVRPTPTLEPTATVSPTPTVAPTLQQSASTITNQALGSKLKKKAKPVTYIICQGKKGKILLKWQKVKGVAGYQIQYSTKKNYKNAKKITLKASKKSYTLKKLKRKKKYYIRIRTTQTINAFGLKTKVYSDWTELDMKTG